MNFVLQGTYSRQSGAFIKTNIFSQRNHNLCVFKSSKSFILIFIYPFWLVFTWASWSSHTYFHFLPEHNLTNKLQEVQVKRFSWKTTFFAAIVPFCSEKFKGGLYPQGQRRWIPVLFEVVSWNFLSKFGTWKKDTNIKYFDLDIFVPFHFSFQHEYRVDIKF